MLSTSVPGQYPLGKTPVATEGQQFHSLPWPGNPGRIPEQGSLQPTGAAREMTTKTWTYWI